MSVNCMMGNLEEAGRRALWEGGISLGGISLGVKSHCFHRERLQLIKHIY